MKPTCRKTKAEADKKISTSGASRFPVKATYFLKGRSLIKIEIWTCRGFDQLLPPKMQMTSAAAAAAATSTTLFAPEATASHSLLSQAKASHSLLHRSLRDSTLHPSVRSPCAAIECPMRPEIQKSHRRRQGMKKRESAYEAKVVATSAVLLLLQQHRQEHGCVLQFLTIAAFFLFDPIE